MPEGVGRNDHRHFAIREAILNRFALGRLKTAVIEDRIYPVLLQFAGDVFCILVRGDVNDAGLVGPLDTPQHGILLLAL